jgi:hypothetical protein
MAKHWWKDKWWNINKKTSGEILIKDKLRNINEKTSYDILMKRQVVKSK